MMAAAWLGIPGLAREVPPGGPPGTERPAGPAYHLRAGPPGGTSRGVVRQDRAAREAGPSWPHLVPAVPVGSTAEVAAGENVVDLRPGHQLLPGNRHHPRQMAGS